MEWPTPLRLRPIDSWWARYSAEDMPNLFRALSKLASRAPDGVATVAAAALPDPDVTAAAKPSPALARDERARLEVLPHHVRTTATLMGEPFEILDAKS